MPSGCGEPGRYDRQPGGAFITIESAPIESPRRSAGSSQLTFHIINQLTVIGFTGSEADVHYTTNGTVVTTLSVATKESWKNADGEWQSRTEWHRVVLFGTRLAEYGRTLAEGSHVMVQGSVRTREYEKDGIRQRVFELRADTIGKLDRAERRDPVEVSSEAD